MSLWTDRHAFPVVLNTNASARSTVFDGKIWTVFEIKHEETEDSERRHETRLYVFDPVSEIFTEINCVYPAGWPKELHTFTANGSDLYMWRNSIVADPDTDHNLFKLNRATFEWESIMMIRTEWYEWWESVVLNEQVMYFLQTVAEEAPFALKTIDMQKREVVETSSLHNIERIRFLSIHNNNVHLIEDLYGVRKVSRFKNGRLFELSKHILTHANSRLSMVPVHCEDSNEYVAYAYGKRFIARNFDFELLEWETDVTTPDWPTRVNIHNIQSVVKVNGSLYILITTYNRGETQFEFHELDLHPKLTSICLADLTNCFSKNNDAQKLDDVKQKFPIQMRAKLEELLKRRNEANKWR